MFSEEGSNRKACEIDVFKNFCDFVQDLGTTQGKNSRIIFIIILLLYIRHRLDMKKCDWSKAFNQFSIACELYMINAILH